MSKTIKEVLVDLDRGKYLGEGGVDTALAEIEQIIRECEPKESICWDGTDISHRFMECATCRANHIVEEYTNDLIERIKGE